MSTIIRQTNEEIAKEIAKGRHIIVKEMCQKECSFEGDYYWEDVKYPIHKQCEQVALQMAEWKDKQYKEREERLRETIIALEARLQRANESY